jgi:hypothetical protein
VEVGRNRDSRLAIVGKKKIDDQRGMRKGIKGHELILCGRNKVWFGSDQAIVRKAF